MEGMGLRQKAVLAMMGVVVLFAIAVATWFLNAESAWQKAAKRYQKEVTRFEREEKLISEKTKWDERYETERAAMPTFAAEQATDTTWLSTVEDLARSNAVLITSIDHGEEIEAGDVLELPIEVKSFEASLEALVRFCHALENGTSGMFDVKKISIAPNKSKPGYLKGAMSITCAYMRGEDKEDK